MTEEEVEAVAEELAKVGGSSWYPGRTTGPLFRAVGDRYRDRARVAIAALDRLRASKKGTEATDHSAAPAVDAASQTHDRLQIGSLVVYRPAGERRAVPCRVEKIAEGRVYLVHCAQPDVGWVSTDGLVSLDTMEHASGE